MASFVTKTPSAKLTKKTPTRKSPKRKLNTSKKNVQFIQNLAMGECIKRYFNQKTNLKCTCRNIDQSFGLEIDF